MVSKTLKLSSSGGLQVRPAEIFSSAACTQCGEKAEVRCDGADEAVALVKAVEFIEIGLGETR